MALSFGIAWCRRTRKASNEGTIGDHTPLSDGRDGLVQIELAGRARALQIVLRAKGFTPTQNPSVWVDHC